MRFRTWLYRLMYKFLLWIKPTCTDNEDRNQWVSEYNKLLSEAEKLKIDLKGK